MINLQDYFQIGRIGKAHGLKGELRVSLYSGMPDILHELQEIVLQKSENEHETYSLQKCRWQGRHLIAKLASVADRDASESLNGDEIWVKKSDVPALGSDQHYWFEYEGLIVETDEGIELGVVQDVFATGANDVLVVTGQGQEYLIPIIDDVLVAVDTAAGRIVISPLPGLLDINS